MPAELKPWVGALAPGEGWLVLVVAVAALEGLAAFHERVGEAIAAAQAEGAGGLLLPGPWEERRRQAREHGLVLAEPVRRILRDQAERAGMPGLD